MKKISSIIAALLCATEAYAFEDFKAKEIRLEGLQRIDAGTVFNYLPIQVGDTVTEENTSQLIRELFKTGFFKDVRLEREGDDLVVFVAERPAIAEIKITGNDDIPSDALATALKDLGLVEGQVFDRSLLDVIDKELKRQYYSLGKYAITIKTTVVPLERNRIAINIDIAEGDKAEVYSINIIGNKKYTDKQILDEMKLADESIFGGKENYSKQIFAGDIESIRSLYLDSGHINFKLNSTQVALTPDKHDVYITVNLTEGDVFTVSDIKILGSKVIPRKELDLLITVVPGEIFSKKKIIKIRKNISDRLAELGYPYASININPELDKDSKTVSLDIHVDEGRRVYVRRINISGNRGTRDEVVRRELRLMETEWLSTKQIALSRRRLNRTGFYEYVDIKSVPVPGDQDLVDVNVTVKERATGSLTLGLGFSDTQGALFNFAITQSNFFGSGKRVAIELNNSEATNQYRFSITDPYHTKEGVSRTISFLSREIDAEEADISNYIINTNQLSVHYGIPLGETSSTSLGVAVEQTELISSATTATEITDFTTMYGSEYDTYSLTWNWAYDNRNRAIFADDGTLVSVSAKATAPGSDLEFYSIGLKLQQFFKLSDDYTLTYKVQFDYGDGYGDTTYLPPYQNYFAGGSRSVRGYDGNSLGPKDSTGQPLGGDRRVTTNLEVILPNPFSNKDRSVRLTAFIDGGYVYGTDQDLDLGEMRYAAGLGLVWIAPIGTLRFSIAEPLNDKFGDDTSRFQFTLGAPF